VSKAYEGRTTKDEIWCGSWAAMVRQADQPRIQEVEVEDVHGTGRVGSKGSSGEKGGKEAPYCPRGEQEVCGRRATLHRIVG